MEARKPRSETFGVVEEERELLRRCRDGDLEAYGLIVERYQRRVYEMIARMVRNRAAAEDLAQETFLRGFKGMHGFDPERRFLPWILRIGTNLTIDFLNQASRREVPRPGDSLQVRQEATDEEDRLASRERLAMVEQALLMLPPKYRVPLMLKHAEGMSYKEIEQIMDLPVRVLKMRVYRARRRLKHNLKKIQNARKKRADE